MYHLESEISGKGENLNLKDTADYRFKEFNIYGNSKQETREGYNLLKGDTYYSNSNTDTRTFLDFQIFASYTSLGQHSQTIGQEIISAKGRYYYTFTPTQNCVGIRIKHSGSQVDLAENYSIQLTSGITYTISLDITGINPSVQGGFSFENVMVYKGSDNKPYEPYGASPSPDYPSEIKSAGDNMNLLDFDGFLKNAKAEYTFENSIYSLTKTGNLFQVPYKLELKSNTTYTISQDYIQQSSTNIRLIIVRKEGTSYKNVAISTMSATKENRILQFTTDGSSEYYIRGDWSTLVYPMQFKHAMIYEGIVDKPYSPYGQGNINEVICNKNLIDMKKAEKDKYISHTTGDVKVYVGQNAYVTDFIKVQEGHQYIYSGYKTVNQGNTGAMYDKNKKFIKGIVNDTDIKPLTIPQGVKYIRLSIFGNNFEDISNLKPQLEQNSTPTSYVEHQEQTISIPTQKPFRSEGETRDEFIQKDGKWFERHYNEEVIFDGTENITYNSNKTEFVYPLSNIGKFVGGADTKQKIKSNYFVSITFNSGYKQQKDYGVSYGGSSADKICFRNADFSTVASFKAWLKEKYDNGKPVYVDYILATPEDIECTEEQSLILDNLQNFNHSYQGETNIYSTDEIAPELNVKTYKGITDRFKERLLTGKVTRAYMKVLETDTLPEMIIDETNYLKDIQFDELRYVPNEGFIGGTVAKRVTGNFNNVDNNFSIQDREFELYMGVDIDDNSTEYINYGTYIVQKPEDNQVNDNTSFEALDYMVRLNVPYVDRIQYPCTLKELFDDVVKQSGLQNKITSFDNDDFIVENNQFEVGTTLRDVLKAISQVAFNWIRINEYNEIEMDFLNKTSTDEYLDEDKYYNLKSNEEYGPVNVVILRNGQVEGENVAIRDESVRDEISIEKNGEIELVISDNPFAYTQEKRAQLIKAAKKIFGLRYIPVSMDMIGYMYLNCKDKIRIETPSKEQFDTYILNHTIKYSGVITDSMESPAMTKTETKYQFTGDISQTIAHTELIVDKANKKIEGIVEIQDKDRSEFTKFQQTTNEFLSTVATKDYVGGQISDFRQTIDGTITQVVKSGGNNIFYYAEEYWNSGSEDKEYTGEYIYADDIKTDKGKLEVYGNSKQEGEPSPDNPVEIKSAGGNVNLYDKEKDIDGSYIGETGSIKKSTGHSYSDLIPIEINTNYIFSGIHTRTGGTNNNKRIHLYNSSGEWLEQLTYKAISVVGEYSMSIYPTNANGKYIRISHFNDDTNCKLEQGTISTSYSEYNQGNINEVICNKNLFDTYNYIRKSTTVSDIQIDDNSVIANFNGEYSAITYEYNLLNKKYIISVGEISQSVARLEISFYKNNVKIGDTQTTKNTFEINNENMQYDKVRINLSNATYVGILQFKNIQIEEGTTPTSYVEHQEQTISIPTQKPFRSIGEIRDEFVQKDGKWYERHYIGEVIFDGSENWILTRENVYSIPKPSNMNTGEVNMKSNYFSKFSKSFDDIEDYGMSVENYVNVKNKDIINSLSNFKQWVSTHNIELYYPIITPEDIECTEEQTQILNSLDNITIYRPITHIIPQDETPAYLKMTSLNSQTISLEREFGTEIKQNTISGMGYILNNGISEQKQEVKNGDYTVSFLYSKLITLANAYVLINNTRYDLETTELNKWYEMTIPINIDTNTIDIQIVCDTDKGFMLADLMGNAGAEKMVWSQNANETITNDVTIGKGIQVNSSITNTYTRIDADGNRVYNKATGDVVSEQTDKGTKTNELEVVNQAKINVLLIQNVDGQVWLTGIGG